MLICLYGDMPTHVDSNFMIIGQFTVRSEDPVILWDRNGTLRAALSTSKASPTKLDWQWIEDRFWTWIQYVATKVGRGELFEAIRFLSFLQEKVLGPIAIELSGGKSYGVRHFEQIAATYGGQMRTTVASYDRKEIAKALLGVVEVYKSFRQNRALETLRMDAKTEEVVMRYLWDVLEQVGRACT